MELERKGWIKEKGLITDSISENIRMFFQKMQKIQSNTGLEGLLKPVNI